MKQENVFVQLGMVGFSLLLAGSILFFSVQFISDYGKASTFQEDLSGVDEVVVPLSYETRNAKGDQLFQAGYYELAATEYAFAINIQPKNPVAYGKLGETQLKLGENEKALEALSKAMNYAKNDNYRFNYAIALIRTHAFEEANTHLQALEPKQEVLFYRTLLESYLGNYEEAQDLLKNSLATAGSVPLSLLNQLEAAYADFNAQLEGQDSYLRALLTQVMIDAGEHQLAEASARNILNEKNDYRDVWILLGYSQLKTKQYQEAEDSFKAAKNLDPIKPETHYFLGSSHFLQGEYEAAISEFELALLHGFEPEEEVYRQLAESQLFLENYEDALAAYEFLIKLDPSDIEGFAKPVQISVDSLNDLDRALTLAEEGVLQFPNDPNSHNLLASVYLEKGEWALAEASMKKALNLNPKWAETHFNLGLLAEAQGDFEAASKHYKSAHEYAESGSLISISAAEKFNALALKNNQ